MFDSLFGIAAAVAETAATTDAAATGEATAGGSIASLRFSGICGLCGCICRGGGVAVLAGFNRDCRAL